MNAQDLTLNIAVNLGRLSRWATENKELRIKQFLAETEGYINQLEKAPKNARFNQTLEIFLNKFNQLKQQSNHDLYWADDMLTWANILTHRAKFA